MSRDTLRSGDEVAGLSFQTLLDGLDGITYVVDRAGVIRAIGRPNWAAFASGNGADGLAGNEAVIGRPIMDFVAGQRVAEAYRGYMGRLFSGEIPHIRFPFRCDAPEVRRENWMVIRPIATESGISALLFQSLTLRETERPPIDLFDVAQMRAMVAATSGWPIVTICSYCHAISAGEKKKASDWITAEAYYRAGGKAEVRLSHGICPTCYHAHVLTFMEGDGDAVLAASPG